MPEQQQHVSFFDEISKNKRNSWILLIFMAGLFSVLVFVLSYVFGLGTCGLAIGMFALLFYFVIAYWSGDKMILSISHAKEAKKEENPYLYNVVEGLALASFIPMPKVYIVDDPSPNAFATGRDPKHASVAVTTGLLKLVNQQELEGVLAHEISHIANYDIQFSMYAIVFVGAIGLLSNLIVQVTLINAMTGGLNRRGDRRRGGGGEGGIILMIIGFLFALIVPIIAQLVNLAISRQREYLADANGAKLTRYPPGLASALEKITGMNVPTQSASEMTAPLYFANPFPHKLTSLLSTHPDPVDRIKRLRAM